MVALVLLLVVGAAGCDGQRTLGIVGDSNVANRPSAVTNGLSDYALDNRAISGASILPGTAPWGSSSTAWNSVLAGMNTGAVVIEPNLQIVDWASVAQPEHFSAPYQDVHLTFAGALLWATLVSSEVAKT